MPVPPSERQPPAARRQRLPRRPGRRQRSARAPRPADAPGLAAPASAAACQTRNCSLNTPRNKQGRVKVQVHCLPVPAAGTRRTAARVAARYHALHDGPSQQQRDQRMRLPCRLGRSSCVQARATDQAQSATRAPGTARESVPAGAPPCGRAGSQRAPRCRRRCLQARTSGGRRAAGLCKRAPRCCRRCLQHTSGERRAAGLCGG